MINASTSLVLLTANHVSAAATSTPMMYSGPVLTS